MTYAIAAGALLALVFLLRRQAAAAPAAAGVPLDPNAIDPTTGLPASAGGSTFADNGAAAAGSLDNVTGAINDLTAGMATLGQNQQALADLFGPGGAGVAPTDTGSAPAPVSPLDEAKGILELAHSMVPTVAPSSPTNTAPRVGTTPGYHAGHSSGHEYYLPGVGWVSAARYSSGGGSSGGGSSGSGSGAAHPTVGTSTPVGGGAAAATAAGFHGGHSRGHEYYLPGVGWVSRTRYQRGR